MNLIFSLPFSIALLGLMQASVSFADESENRISHPDCKLHVIPQSGFGISEMAKALLERHQGYQVVTVSAESYVPQAGDLVLTPTGTLTTYSGTKRIDAILQAGQGGVLPWLGSQQFASPLRGVALETCQVSAVIHQITEVLPTVKIKELSQVKGSFRHRLSAEESEALNPLRIQMFGQFLSERCENALEKLVQRLPQCESTGINEEQTQRHKRRRMRSRL